MKGLLLRFLIFVGMLYFLERLSLMIVIVGVGLGLVCMAVLHILANPDTPETPSTTV